MSESKTIGTLREKSLHAALKEWLAEPGDRIEQKVEKYHIDILRGNLLIEIQTGSFIKIRNKLNSLLENHKVLLVHPIPQRKWIVKTTRRLKPLGRRRSPKRGRVEDIFNELLFIPEIATHPNFQLLVLLTQQEEIWRDDGHGSWRRKYWSIADKVLLDVVGSYQFTALDDYLALIPASLKTPFTHRQLATAINAPIWMGARMSYCLRKMGALAQVGKQGRSLLLDRTDTMRTDGQSV